MTSAHKVQLLLEKLAQADLVHQTVSRQLHDEAGQTVAALGLHLDAIKYDLRKLTEEAAAVPSDSPKISVFSTKLDDSVTALTEVQKLLTGVMETLRQTSKALGKDPVDRLGLHRSLEALAEASSKNDNRKCSYAGRPTPSCPKKLGSLLFRITEQAINLIPSEEGGHAAEIQLEFDDGNPVLTITLTGYGTPITLTDTLGFDQMQFWAKEAAMKISLDSSSGKGTIIKVFPNQISGKS